MKIDSAEERKKRDEMLWLRELALRKMSLYDEKHTRKYALQLRIVFTKKIGGWLQGKGYGLDHSYRYYRFDYV